jgi:hypothetical protein
MKVNEISETSKSQSDPETNVTATGTSVALTFESWQVCLLFRNFLNFSFHIPAVPEIVDLNALRINRGPHVV